MTTVYNFSGGAESAAMLVVDREKIEREGALVCWVDTGKQFPEMYESIDQITEILGIDLIRLRQDYTFDEFLFERGGMLRQGYTDCSRRMKRAVLRRHLLALPSPYTVALGFNASETRRAEEFVERNETDEMHWHFPLIERGIDRAESYRICRAAGFTILMSIYDRMGRSDCYFCPNQRIAQAQKVMLHYPDLWAEWKEIERKKGHPILKISAANIERLGVQDGMFEEGKIQCGCFGGEEFE